MDDYVLTLQEDLRKRLDHLCWMHNEPALHVTEHFAELRRQVDLDAERLLSEIQLMKRETGKAPKDSDVNETRLEFIRILGELEKRTGLKPKPQNTSSDVYASFEQRVNAFKDSSSSLDDLEETYVQLAQEILVETNRVEKCILGEQTIIYWPREDGPGLGSLVYFGDIFLSRKEVNLFIDNEYPTENARRPQSYSHSDLPLLVQTIEPRELSKSKQVAENLSHSYYVYKFGKESKFFYVGNKTEEDYSGYSAAEGSSVDKEFVSYQNDDVVCNLSVEGNVGLDTSVNFFDVYSSTECNLEMKNVRLESLNVHLLPTPVSRLTELTLKGVHFVESLDTHLLAKCTNLTELVLETTFSKKIKFEFAFLGALTKLETLELMMPHSPTDLSVLMTSLTELKNLTLKGSSHFYAEKLPRLSKATLEPIFTLPRLESLKLSCFDIEIIDWEMLSKSRCLSNFELTQSSIGHTNLDDIAHLGFSSSSRIRLLHKDGVSFDATSFVGIANLWDLSLTDNSIIELPPGVFRDLVSLRRLRLDKNFIRHQTFARTSSSASSTNWRR